jgi:hypothetical protein
MSDHMVKVVATYEMVIEIVDAQSVDEANSRALEIAKDLEQYCVCVADLPEPFAFDSYDIEGE